MIFHPSDRDRLNLYVTNQFDRGKTLKIEIVTTSKTLNQLRYIHMVFAHIADQCGYRMEEAKKHYKATFPKYEEINFKGETELIQIASLRDFSKEQMSVFIDEVTTDARQEGFLVPDPEDKKASELYEYYRNKGII